MKLHVIFSSFVHPITVATLWSKQNSTMKNSLSVRPEYGYTTSDVGPIQSTILRQNLENN